MNIFRVLKNTQKNTQKKITKKNDCKENDCKENDYKENDYQSLFIKKTDLPPARFGKSVYLRKEYHDRISQIVSVIGENEVSIFGYIDNVLAHHFDTFQDDITRSFKKKIIFK